ATALFTVNLHAALLPGQGGESAMAVAFEPQTAPAIVTRSLAVRRKKILAQKNIFVSVTIDIRDAHAKRRRKLSLARQHDRCEVIATIEKHRGLQPRRIQNLRCFSRCTQQLAHTGGPECSVGGEPF